MDIPDDIRWSFWLQKMVVLITEDGRPDAEDGRPDAEDGRPDARDGRPDAEDGRPDAEDGRFNDRRWSFQMTEDGRFSEVLRSTTLSTV